MKKKLIEAIKAKFVGIDDNTANRLAERTIRKGDPITTDDEVNAAVETISLSDVLKSVSDFSADDAKRKYEEKYGLKDGAPVKKEPEEKPEEKQEPEKKEEKADPIEALKAAFLEMQKALNGKIDALGTDITAIKTGKLTESRRARIDAIINPLRDSQKKAYTRIPVDKLSEDEFDNLISDIQSEVNDIVAENKAAGGVVTAPLGGRHLPPQSGKEATKEEMDALVGKFNLS